MKVKYEWDVEELDEHGDIINHNHTESYEEAVGWAKSLKAEGVRVELALVRDIVEEDGNVVSRSWTYADEEFRLGQACGFLSASGSYVCLVPKRFIKESRRRKVC